MTRNTFAITCIIFGLSMLVRAALIPVIEGLAQDHPRPAAQCSEAPSVRFSRVEGGEFVAHTLEFSVDGKTWAMLPVSTTWPRYWIREKVGELEIRRWEVVR